MPKLDLTIPAEALSDGDQQELARELGATLLRWEGAPDTEFFRSITWAHVHPLPAESIQTPDGVAEPHAVVDITVPSGALSERRKAGLVEDVTKLDPREDRMGRRRRRPGLDADPRGAGRQLGCSGTGRPLRAAPRRCQGRA